MINLLEAFKNEAGLTKKKFGQHFLTNKALLQKIIEEAEINENDNVIEIGPGCGVLTQLIAETKANTIALEIDTELIEFLHRYLFFYKNVQILNQDASNVDYNKLFENEPVKEKIHLSKTDASSGEGIEGVCFDILAKEDIVTPDGTVRLTAGETAGTLITDQEGKAESEELFPGKYELVEKKVPAAGAGALLPLYRQGESGSVPVARGNRLWSGSGGV